MKLLYLSCEMGAAGDMLMAALYELLPDKQMFLDRMNGLLPGVTVTAEESVKCGIRGTHMRVSVHGTEEETLDEGHEQIHAHAHEHHHDRLCEHTHDAHTQEPIHGHDHAHHHEHKALGDVTAIVDSLALPESVRTHAKAVYASIAAAEAEVHGRPVNEVHFHEVGALDAVTDVVGVCLLLELLQPDRIVCSPVHVGSGMVRCAHGLLPVPAPATEKLLAGVPIYSGSIRGELCTPTGAALLKHFCASFGPMPVMTPEKSGFGMGSKDFEACNAVRAIWGETASGGDEILELRCNLDDMSGEELGFAMEQLFSAGALDVFTQPIGMKKSRPGILLICLCRPEQREELLRLLFRHTTTLGVRETACRRSTLNRREETVETEFGSVRVKHASGWGTERSKAEYDDLAAIAKQTGRSLAELRALLRDS